MALLDEKGKKKHLQKLEHCETANAPKLTHFLYDCNQAGSTFWAEGTG